MSILDSIGAGANALSPLASLFGSIFGPIQGAKNQDWLRGGLSTILENLQNQGVAPGMGIFNTIGGNVNQNSSQNVTNLMNGLWGENGSGGTMQELAKRLGDFQAAIPSLYARNQSFQNDNTQAAQGGLQQLFSSMQDPRNTASQLFQGGGWTPQYQDTFDKLSQYFQSVDPGNSAQLSKDIANEMLTNRGQTPFTSSTGDTAGGVVNSGGMTSTLQGALPAIRQLLGMGGSTPGQETLNGVGSNTLNTGGLTPTGAVGEGTALQGLLAGGTNPILQALSQHGLDLASRESIMSPLQARALAENEAATGYKGQAEQAYAKALARGGGPGATVANGLQNQSLADFSDQMSQGVSKAGTDALMQQQDRALQQNQIGTQQTLGANNTAQNFLQTFAGLLNGLEGNSAQRFGTGGNFLTGAGQLNTSRLLGALGANTDVQHAATSNAGTFGQLGLGAGNLDLSRINSANGVAQMLAQLFKGGLDTQSGVMGNQNQYALGGGNLFNNLTNGGGNILNSLFGNEMSGGQLALGQNNGFTNAMHNGFGNNIQFVNTQGNMLKNSMDPLTALAGQGADIWRTGLQGYPSTLGGSAGQLAYSPWNFGGGK